MNLFDNAMNDSLKTTLVIDLENIKFNYKELKKLSPNSDVGAVVKANAYGLGVDKVAPILLNSGCKHFFVSSCDEAIALRLIIGDGANIYALHGVFYNEIEEFLQYDLVPVLNHLEQIKLWQKYAYSLERNLPCLIHIDSGMNRLGLSESELALLNFDNIKNLDIIYVMSHLTSSEDINSDSNKIQLKKFSKLSQKFKNSAKSLANSNGIFLGSNYHFDLTRSGAAIYGINPTKAPFIKPVISLFTQIIEINSLETGQSVGYNGSYTNLTKESLVIATIEIGYANGFSRCFSNKGKVVIDGYEAPIIGLISMDLTIIDISKIPKNLIFLGQKVEILGENLTIDEVAKLGDITSYEILTSIGSRCRKKYNFSTSSLENL